MFACVSFFVSACACLSVRLCLLLLQVNADDCVRGRGLDRCEALPRRPPQHGREPPGRFGRSMENDAVSISVRQMMSTTAVQCQAGAAITSAIAVKRRKEILLKRKECDRRRKRAVATFILRTALGEEMMVSVRLSSAPLTEARLIALPHSSTYRHDSKGNAGAKRKREEER